MDEPAVVKGLCRAWRLAACLLCLFVSACGVSRDAEQTRVCRSALPALNPGARITVMRVKDGPAPRSLRVEYLAAYPDRPLLERFVICQFAAEGLSPNK